ncbi:exonuclease domain-containing protein [Anoxybacillus sp. J5B_2022]|uniref:exonuclease domain-containing protein n=1 Tax=Anoxybacillus sp. J5B_2022 TaxID=3003246 RepID=UPI0022865813|nr:exonuclease domain-containing protein [Anoxybacillus sp. J5B_2022]MCZ0755018.1 exonuclease domain-containing protein [Anoxybacillus sp. J5B_2022]
MNEQHRFWQRALRMLSLGVPSEKVSSVSENERHTFQQEVWVRTLLKEQQKKHIDMNTHLEHIPFIIIDTETTGFSPQHGDEIFSIAAAKTRNGQLNDFYFRLIRPEKEIPEHISQLTGIRMEDVQSAPRLKEEMKHFLSFISDGLIIGYHIGHDLSFMNHFLWTNYRTKWTGRFLEMQQVMEMIHRPVLFPTLDEALHHYDIPCEKRHTADGDVRAMVELWKRMLEDLKQKQIETLYDLYTALSVMPR